MGLSSLGNIFGAAVDNKPPVPLQPLQERNIIPIKADDGVTRNAVNFNYIFGTGKVPTELYDKNYADYYSDFKRNDPAAAAQDPFLQALKTIEDGVALRIQESSEIQTLFLKPRWGKDERQQWERLVSQIVSEEMDKIPGLQDYRTSS